jgi:hypothetical protein
MKPQVSHIVVSLRQNILSLRGDVSIHSEVQQGGVFLYVNLIETNR